jgi:hypothetical protein
MEGGIEKWEVGSGNVVGESCSIERRAEGIA